MIKLQWSRSMNERKNCGSNKQLAEALLLQWSRSMNERKNVIHGAITDPHFGASMEPLDERAEELIRGGL